MATQRQLDLTVRQLCQLQKVRIDMNRLTADQRARESNDNEDDFEIYKGRKVKKIGPP